MVRFLFLRGGAALGRFLRFAVLGGAPAGAAALRVPARGSGALAGGGAVVGPLAAAPARRGAGIRS